MKKFFSFILCLSLCLTACFFVGCGKKDKNVKINWDGLTIKNFENYEYLGVAAMGSKKTNASVKLAVAEEKDSLPNGPVVLAGITGAGECEEITFVNDKGKVTKQNAHLVRFDAYKRYSFAIFSIKSDEYKDSSWNLKDSKKDYSVTGSYVGITNGDGTSDSFMDSYFFIIDNKNGKIYSFESIAKTLNMTDYATAYFSADTLNYDYFAFVIDTHTQYDRLSVYEVRFKENNIEVSQRMNFAQVENFFQGSSYNYNEDFAFDKFGNVFNLKNVAEGSAYLKVDGEFSKFESHKQEDEQANYYLGFNGVLYREIKKNDEIISKAYLAADGNFAEIDKDLVYPHASNQSSYYNDNTLIWHKGNVYYFGYTSVIYSSTYNAKLVVEKVTTSTENDWEYTIETIVLENYEGPSYTNFSNLLSNMVFANDCFYTVDGEDVFYYNATNGEKHQIENNYKVKNIFVDRNLNVVKVTVIDNTTLLDINGYINENNEIVLEEFDPEFAGAKRVYVIAPLN